MQFGVFAPNEKTEMVFDAFGTHKQYQQLD